MLISSYTKLVTVSEYHAQRGNGRKAFISAALDPKNQPSKAQLADIKTPKKTRYSVGIILFPGFEVLDVFGPMEMWGYIPEFELVLIAEKAGHIRSAQGAVVQADFSFSNAPALDIVMIPGGNGTRAELQNPAMINYLQQVHKNSVYTTSVCTGSALLAKAGILDGHKATTNKRFFFLSEQQSNKVDWVADARWVQSGNIFTSSGVSAGTDMSLGLVAKIFGKDTAHELASAVEYNLHDDAEQDPFASYVNRMIPANADSKKKLLKTSPQANSTASSTPRYLHFIFNDLPDVAKSDIKLYSAEKRDTPIVLSSLHTMGANDLMISVSEELPAGDYIVEWRTALGEKKEELNGIFYFTVIRAIQK